MNKCPKIGDRVRYKGANHVGPCEGVVTAIYPTFEWDEETELEGARKPEREWHVGMKPDVKPDPWVYVNSDTFAPSVAELRKAPP